MPPPITRTTSNYILKRIVRRLPTTATTSGSHPSFRCLSTEPSQSQQKKLERIADELLSLNKIERYDYSVLFRLRLGLHNSAPSLAGLDPSAAAGQQAGAGGAAKAEEKTSFDVKLEKFDAAAKIKVIKEVRGFTDLGLKEAKDLVEKAPAVIKKGVTKEEGESIVEKMKALGATAVLE